MARPPRNVLMNIVRNFLDSLKPKRLNTELIGVDKLGNKYFEAKVTASSNRRRPSRYYLPAAGEEDFDQKLPAEWESWLRGRRKLPPSPEEIDKNDALAMLKKENAQKLSAERKEVKVLDLPKEPLGPESFPNYGKEFELTPGTKQGG